MLIITDMDGTLTESRQTIKKNAIDVICKILKKHLFCIISGATYERIKKQVLNEMPIISDIKNMYIVAQSGAEVYDCSRRIHKKYMNATDKIIIRMLLQRILTSNKEILEKYNIETGTSNPLIVDKGSQLTFSIVGVNTNIEIKKQIDPDMHIRKAMVEKLKPFLPPHIKMAIGGSTSIDFTPHDVSKRYGVQYLQKYLGVNIKDIIYIGDKCFVGGNDWIGEEYKYHNVNNSDETLKILKELV